MYSEVNDCLWSFGYGSNMDVKALESKKGVKVIEHAPAILPNFRLSFSVFGPSHVEPAYANIVEEQGTDVHGVAFCMDLDSVARLDQQERGYNKKMVTLDAYDGRKLNGFVYVSKTPPTSEKAPSGRYLGVLMKGARQAGLNNEYVERLSKYKAFEAPPETIAIRKARPDPSTLQLFTVEELAEHKPPNEDTWTSCLGYIVKCNSYFGSHKGRDITSRVLMQFHGIPLDDNDDGGRPPYPLLKDLSDDELEYITRWLDHYHIGPNPDTEAPRPIVGYLKEFADQQSSGVSTFKLPEIPA